MLDMTTLKYKYVTGTKSGSLATVLGMFGSFIDKCNCGMCEVPKEEILDWQK